MALQTANQFQLVPDLASRFTGGIKSGQDISSQFQVGQLRSQEIEQGEELAASRRLVNSALTISALPDERKLGALIKNRASILSRGGDTAETDAAIELAQSGNFEELNQGLRDVISIGERQGIIEAPAAGPSALEQAQTARTIAQTGQIGKEKPVATSALDQARINKLNAETAALGKGAATTTPALDALVARASPELQQQAKAAFELSGGGDKGVKALQKVLETGVESERRAAAPETLKANFPQADEAELQELQAVVDSAKTTESGFKAADKLRTKQRQVKKGKDFQKRAVALLDRILDNPELNDVIGSRQGADRSPVIPFLSTTTFRTDKEAEAVADIEEAGDILTADNLDIMSGVLSETDIQIIANLAGGALNRTRGEATFRKDVIELRDKLQAAVGVVGGDKLPTGTTDNKDGTFTLPNGTIVRRKRG